MTIADHGAPAVARRLVTTTAGAVATGDTRVGCSRTVAGCWAILTPSTATGETCGHGGSERWSVGWIVQLSVASS
jgi:hypothetical protein